MSELVSTLVSILLKLLMVVIVVIIAFSILAFILSKVTIDPVFAQSSSGMQALTDAGVTKISALTWLVVSIKDAFTTMFEAIF